MLIHIGLGAFENEIFPLVNRLVNKVIEVIDWSQLQCNSNINSNRLNFFKCNSNRLKFYLLHLLHSIIFLLQFTLCYFSEGGCRKMIT